MTVKKKIEKNPDRVNKSEEIEQFINRGGKTTEESRNLNDIKEDQLSRFTIRIPNGLVKMIDGHRKTKVGNISRNCWILEAIAKRLTQED